MDLGWEGFLENTLILGLEVVGYLERENNSTPLQIKVSWTLKESELTLQEK